MTYHCTTASSSNICLTCIAHCKQARRTCLLSAGSFFCRSANFARACAHALGPASAHLHPTDTKTRQETVDILLARMADPHHRSDMQAACAESLGLYVASSESVRKASDAPSVMTHHINEGLLHTLCTLCPAAVAPVKKMTQSAPNGLSSDLLQGIDSAVIQQDADAEVVLGVMAGNCYHACSIHCIPHMLTSLGVLTRSWYIPSCTCPSIPA